MDDVKTAQELLSKESWLPTPLLPASIVGGRLGIDLWLKREDCTPIGSFKLRGALVTAAQRADSARTSRIYVASAGNYGLAIAFACQRRHLEVTVVVPDDATPSKLERIRATGARVVEYGDDFDAAKEWARGEAESEGALFWEDGVVEEMVFGAATIAVELILNNETWDYVLVPVGNGSLVKGVASVLKARSPTTRIVGLVPEGAPSMAYGITGRAWDESESVATIADGLAVRVPIRSMVEDLRHLVDEVWLVPESKLLPAVRSLVELEQVMVEPAAAIGVAGLHDHGPELQGRRAVAIVTGAHLRPSILEQALSGDGLF